MRILSLLRFKFSGSSLIVEWEFFEISFATSAGRSGYTSNKLRSKSRSKSQLHFNSMLKSFRDSQQKMYFLYKTRRFLINYVFR